MLNCLVIDDEPLARKGLENYIQELDFLNLVGMGSNPMELSTLLNQFDVDLIFLDIQMPIMNGIEFLKIKQNLPLVILTTAYPSYALEGYQLDVTDYLLKPITFNRFFQAANKAKEYHQLLNKTNQKSVVETPARDSFFIKCDHKYEKIFFDEILYVQALQNYVTIHTKDRKYTTLLFLKNVEEYLDTKQFIRVHKSFIVSIPQIDRIEKTKLIIGDHQIPMSRNFRSEILEKILGNKLWKNK